MQGRSRAKSAVGSGCRSAGWKLFDRKVRCLFVEGATVLPVRVLEAEDGSRLAILRMQLALASASTSSRNCATCKPVTPFLAHRLRFSNHFESLSRVLEASIMVLGPQKPQTFSTIKWTIALQGDLITSVSDVSKTAAIE